MVRHLGLPVRVGIAATRGLAKVALEAAKRTASYRDVVNLFALSDEELDALLETIPVGDLWNVGPHSAARLQSHLHILTGKQLRHADPFHIRTLFNVNLQRVVLELNGIPCIPLEVQPKPKQEIMTALSFNRTIREKAELQNAVAHYT